MNKILKKLLAIALVAFPLLLFSETNLIINAKINDGIVDKPFKDVPFILVGTSDEPIIVNGTTNSTSYVKSDENGLVKFDVAPEIPFQIYTKNWSTEYFEIPEIDLTDAPALIKLPWYESDSFLVDRGLIETNNHPYSLSVPIKITNTIDTVSITNTVNITFKLKPAVDFKIEYDLGNFEVWSNIGSTLTCLTDDTLRFKTSVTNFASSGVDFTSTAVFEESASNIVNTTSSQTIPKNNTYDFIHTFTFTNSATVAITNTYKHPINNIPITDVKTFYVNARNPLKGKAVFYGDSFIDYDNNGRDECGEVQKWSKPDMYIPMIKYWLGTQGLGNNTKLQEQTFITNGDNLNENKYTATNLVNGAYYTLYICYPKKYIQSNKMVAIEKHGFKRVNGYPKTNNVHVSYGDVANVDSIVDAFSIFVESGKDEYDFEYMISPDASYVPTFEIANLVDNVLTNSMNDEIECKVTIRNTGKTSLKNFTAQIILATPDGLAPEIIKKSFNLGIDKLEEDESNFTNFSFKASKSGIISISLSATGEIPIVDSTDDDFSKADFTFGLSKEYSFNVVVPDGENSDFGYRVLRVAEINDLVEEQGVKPLNALRAKFGLTNITYSAETYTNEYATNFMSSATFYTLPYLTTNNFEQEYFYKAMEKLDWLAPYISETATKEFIPSKMIYTKLDLFNYIKYFYVEKLAYKNDINSEWFDTVIQSQLYDPCNWVYYRDTEFHRGHAFSGKYKSPIPIFNLKDGTISTNFENGVSATNFTYWIDWNTNDLYNITADAYFPCLRYLHWPEMKLCHQSKIEKVKCNIFSTRLGLIENHEYGFASEDQAKNYTPKPNTIAIASISQTDALSGDETITVSDTNIIDKVYKIEYSAGTGITASNMPDPDERYKLFSQEIQIATNEPVREDSEMVFNGWRSTINNNQIFYPDDPFTNDLDVTFTAIWRTLNATKLNWSPTDDTTDGKTWKPFSPNLKLDDDLFVAWIPNDKDDRFFYGVTNTSPVQLKLTYHVNPCFTDSGWNLSNSESSKTKTATLTNINFGNKDGNDFNVTMKRTRNFIYANDEWVSYTPSNPPAGWTRPQSGSEFTKVNGTTAKWVATDSSEIRITAHSEVHLEWSRISKKGRTTANSYPIWNGITTRFWCTAYWTSDSDKGSTPDKHASEEVDHIWTSTWANRSKVGTEGYGIKDGVEISYPTWTYEVKAKKYVIGGNTEFVDTKSPATDQSQIIETTWNNRQNKLTYTDTHSYPVETTVNTAYYVFAIKKDRNYYVKLDGSEADPIQNKCKNVLVLNNFANQVTKTYYTYSVLTNKYNDNYNYAINGTNWWSKIGATILANIPPEGTLTLYPKWVGKPYNVAFKDSNYKTNSIYGSILDLSAASNTISTVSSKPVKEFKVENQTDVVFPAKNNYWSSLSEKQKEVIGDTVESNNPTLTLIPVFQGN